MQATCSPVDAAGIALDLLSLGGTVPAQVSVAVWPAPSAAGTTIELGARDGSAAAMIEGTEWSLARNGQVHFSEYDQEGLAEGWFWIDIEGQPRYEGWFQATWVEGGLLLCG